MIQSTCTKEDIYFASFITKYVFMVQRMSSEICNTVYFKHYGDETVSPTSIPTLAQYPFF